MFPQCVAVVNVEFILTGLSNSLLY